MAWFRRTPTAVPASPVAAGPVAAGPVAAAPVAAVAADQPVHSGLRLVPDRLPLPDRVLPQCVSLACLSGKGGVGKTTTAISLAAAIAELGMSVLAVDCDPQSNLTSGLSVDPYAVQPTVGDVLQGRCGAADAVMPTQWDGLWLMPASPDLSAVEQALMSSLGRERLLHDALQRDGIADHFDVVIFDTPPNFGFHTVNVLGATRFVLVPLQMSGFALRGLKELLRVTHLATERLNPELQVLGVVPTFVNLRTRMSRDMLPAICELSGLRVVEVHVPYTVKLQESGVVGAPVTALAPASPAAEAYRRLAAEVLAAAEEVRLQTRAQA